ncbi:MAG TPA: carboxypeptidase regulatory-like domain-containing protein [Terriglobia bacterium]|jgi:hypothetical protein
MPRINRTLGWVLACSVFACASFLTSTTAGFAQAITASNQYVYPLFNSQAGSEFILNNLSTQAVTAEITLVDSNSGTLVNTFQRVPAETQQRYTAASFALSSFNGSLLITTNGPLSSVATLSDGAGNFETMAPAVASESFYVPFGPANNGIMNLSILNPSPVATSVIILVVGTDGSILGSGQATLPRLGTLTTNINALVPQSAFTQNVEISHVVVRALSNVLGPAKFIYVVASLANFSDDNQGIVGPHLDFALIPGVPPSSATTNSLFPVFVQGADYSTVVQVVNPSGSAITATITLNGSNGQPVANTTAANLQIPANGSVRVGLPNIFTLPAGMIMGSLTVSSQTPVIAAEAVASVSQNGIVVFTPSDPPSTNFAYRTRAADPSVFTGLSFRNSNAVPANLTVLNIPDDGSGASSASLTIPALTLGSETLQTLLPEATTAGFIYISSDSPISAQALEGKTDDSVLANLPAMHSQPNYIPPAATKFFITGNVTNNGVALAGASIQLSGALTTSAVTDASGNYQFAKTPPGAYLVQAVDPGYTMSPASITVNIGSASSRGNNFTATLIRPAITAVQPSGVVAGSPATQIVVAGGPFNNTSEIIFDGVPVATSLTSAGISVTVTTATGGTATVVQNQTVLQATIPAESLVAPRITTVVVENVGPGGFVTSAPQNFGVGSAPPTIEQLSGVPAPLIAGSAGFTFSVLGTGFVPGSTIFVQATALPTTFVSANQLTATVPASLLQTSAVLNVTVVSPPPTAGPSNALTINLTSPAPVVLSISPIAAPVRLDDNAGPLALTVFGFFFQPGAVINVTGPAGIVTIPTTFVSSTTLTGSIPQSALLVGGILAVSVSNPQPSLVAASASVPLVLSNLTPILTQIDAGPLNFDPTSPTISYPAPIIAYGSNFSSASIFALVNPCTPGLVIVPNSVTVAVSTQQQFRAYVAGVQVNNVTWGVMATSGSFSGTIDSTGLYTAPPIVPNPAQVVITAMTASGGLADAVVSISAVPVQGGQVEGSGATAANVVSSHEAVINISVMCSGQYSLQVFNPQPGGGASQILPFGVTAYVQLPPPIINSISPGSVSMSSPAFTLTINGSGFEAGAVVSFGSSTLVPSSITPAIITVSIPAFLLGQAGVIPAGQSGIIPVVVTNPDTSGSTNRVLFSVKNP